MVVGTRLKSMAKIALGWRMRRSHDNPRINHERALIFVHIPKAAGSSVTEAMRQVRVTPRALSPRVGKHATAEEVRALVGRSFWDSAFTFSFVRNPWDLMVSSYHWWLQKAPSLPAHRNRARTVAAMSGFRTFATSTFGRTHINERRGNFRDWLCDARGEQIVRFVGTVETIERDWDDIRRQTGLPLPSLPHVNRSSHDDYRVLYDDAARDIVAERFGWSIERFGYRF